MGRFTPIFGMTIEPMTPSPVSSSDSYALSETDPVESVNGSRVSPKMYWPWAARARLYARASLSLPSVRWFDQPETSRSERMTTLDWAAAALACNTDGMAITPNPNTTSTMVVTESSFLLISRRRLAFQEARITSIPRTAHHS